jgi:hypothetical protein
MSWSNGADVVLAVWQFINLGARNWFGRARPILCCECSHPIRWWNRRIWLVEPERCAHPLCWNGHLFLKALVADERRRSQLIADEIACSPRRPFQHPDNGPAESDLHQVHALVNPLREKVERLKAPLRQGEERGEETPHQKHRHYGDLSPHLGQDERHFMDRSFLFRNFGLSRLVPRRAPRPPCRCMLCGTIAFSRTSAFCTKCGASLIRYSADKRRRTLLDRLVRPNLRKAR